jgi:hypothetical protein
MFKSKVEREGKQTTTKQYKESKLPCCHFDRREKS